MIEHLDHLDFPRREPKTGQPLERLDLDVGEEGRAETIAAPSIGKSGEPIPEVDKAPRQWWEGEFLLELFPTLWCLRAIEETLDMLHS